MATLVSYEIIYYTLVGIGLYFSADWIRQRLEVAASNIGLSSSSIRLITEFSMNSPQRESKPRKPAPSVGEERRAMAAQIEAEAKATAAYTDRKTFSAAVMAAIGKVPRHEFVPQSQAPMAYVNAALPIGFRQTISQPYIVALMTDLLDLEKSAVVLEIGTGSGYQTAVLAEIAKQVYSIDIVQELAGEATERLKRLGYKNVVIRSGDGYDGWPEHAPFDGILVTAVTPDVPPALIEQLKVGGRMAIPVGNRILGEDLMVIEKDQAGEIRERLVLPVAFVPFTRAAQTNA
ncbi:MAG: protein-L-isoaspartate(D-aspartate) O-methyltransferase [Gammaproteobacteria bacterium]